MAARRTAWRADWREVCLEPSSAWNAPPRRTLEGPPSEVARLVRTVASEPKIGAPLVEAACAGGIAICLVAPPYGAGGVYDTSTKLILLSNELPFWSQTIVLAHELRHAQVSSWGMAGARPNSLEAAVRWNLALEADAHSVAVLYAWSAKDAGKCAIWEAALALQDHDASAHALGAALASKQDVGGGCAAAFAAWFDDADRVARYAFHACMGFIARERAGEVPSGTFGTMRDAFERLGTLPSGKHYDVHPP